MKGQARQMTRYRQTKVTSRTDRQCSFCGRKIEREKEYYDFECDYGTGASPVRRCQDCKEENEQ